MHFYFPPLKYLHRLSRHTSLYVLFIFISFAIVNLANAAIQTTPANLKFSHLTKKDGLSQSYVFDIVQDKRGFIWVATEDGLNRYDGANFKYYRSDISDKNSIADNFIRNLYIDKSDTLWVGTANGLSRYNEKLDNFDNYVHETGNINSLSDNTIWGISEDKSGSLWVSTKIGLHQFNKNNNNFARKKIRSLSPQLAEVKTIFQDENSYYWFGSYENGIYIVNDSLTTAAALNKTNNWGLHIPAKTLNQFTEINGNYWLATELGVYVVNKNYELIEHYEFHYPQTQTPVEVRAIKQIKNGEVWLGTNSGIKMLDLVSGLWTSNKKDKLSNTNILDDRIYDLFVDNADRVWVGSLSGITTYSPENNIFKNSTDISSEINDFVNYLTYFKGDVWFSHNSNLHSFKSGNIEQSSIPLSQEIISVNSTSEELIVITDSNQLYTYVPSTNEIVNFPSWKSGPTQNVSNIQIKGKYLWFKDQNNSLSNFSLSSGKFGTTGILPNDKITALKIDSNNNLWFTNTNNQLMYIDHLSNGVKELKVDKEQYFNIKSTTSIAVSDNWVLLGSRSQGALLINQKTGQSRVYNESKNLPNNFISDILVDEQGVFWFGTNEGISALSPNSLKLKNFNQDFGLQISEYIGHSATVTKEGVMFFGGNQGFDYFSPAELLTIEQRIYAPILTNLLVANKRVNVSNAKNQFDEFTLSMPLNSLNRVELSYKDSPLSFEFISPNAKLNNQVAYRYRLTGLDENWIITDNKNRRATYTYPSAGNYTFEVEAFDKLDPSIFAQKSINVYVRPPWWLSASAILIYALAAVLLLIYFLQQLRHKRLYHLQIKQSEERLKLSLWGSGDEMWDWNIKSGKIYRSNIWGILDFPQDGTRNVGGGGETNIHENDNARIRETLQQHIDQKSEHFEVTYRVRDKNNNWIWVLDRGKIVERSDSGEPMRMTGTLKDISQIKKADERLKLFAKCIENISDAVVIYDRKFTIVDVNKAFQRITGKTKKQMAGTSIRFSRYPEKFTQSVKFHLLNKGSWHGEIESKRANGEVYLTDLNIDIIRDENGNISHFVGVFSDITKRKETESELRRLANSDTLTGLPNRSFFQANQVRLVKNKTPHALLVFDLDNFKKVNDSLGHEVGDVLLCQVAERIKQIGRKQDTVYRLGGDEFSILIENTNDIHTITTIAKNILKTIAEPLKLKNQEIVLYSSIGIVLYPEDGATPQELLKNADTAMYHAKHTGGNKYQFFSESMNKKAVKRLQIESLIRHGLKEDFFSVFYQPKIEISTGKVAGMEALVRFETPTKGIISPVVFIPVSEETGQIIDIGEIVLRKSCFATKKWIDAGLFDGRIAVNLSAVQFTQPNLVGMISDILKESQLPAKHLELEITEGTVMDSPQAAIDTMLQIRAMGIHLSLDDFGTGYSSLAYLKKFPLNTLKIDKAFVDDIEGSEQGRNMVATIVTIAHNLGLQVVAEGVETNQQLNFLAGLRCEQLQGYLYSKPLAEKNFQSYLLSHQITDKSTSFNKS